MISFAKICCYEKDNNENHYLILSAALVIYNGEVETKDINGNLTYWATDDIYQMFMLMKNLVGYIQKVNKITTLIKLPLKEQHYPQFTRYNIESNVITD